MVERIVKGLMLGLAFLILTGCGGCTKSTQKLSGSGSTFIKPIMDKWIEAYTKEKSDLEINYQGTGSTAGIKQMTDQAVDFGCTDAFMTAEQLEVAKKHDGEVLHIPLVMGAIVPAYNLKDVDKPINFTPEILAGIFLGEIETWDDPALKKINEGVALPNKKIAVVHRTEGSGSTFIFTSYLQKSSKAWQESGVGAGTTVNWKTGTGEQGNPGVAGFISQTDGSIGYIELYYALLKKDEIKFGAVQNQAGKFIHADLKGVTVAAENSLKDKNRISGDLNMDLLNAPGEESYPISGATWAVLYTKQEPQRSKALVDFLTWATHEGQKLNEGMHYARLPEALVKRIDEKLQKIKK
ncbi:MAG TPA: phosphate ABC transporter substrate-binding protein PstS [Gemmataceae bacterium]|nr:phosphate ABC transporter substrate-binding protein PstS [Gemmataceae bacterium]